jgi:hypothetical protein
MIKSEAGWGGVEEEEEEERKAIIISRCQDASCKKLAGTNNIRTNSTLNAKEIRQIKHFFTRVFLLGTRNACIMQNVSCGHTSNEIS